MGNCSTIAFVEYTLHVVCSNHFFHGVHVLYWLHSWRTVSVACANTQAVMDERFWCVLQPGTSRYVSQRLFSKPASPMPCAYPMHTQHLLCVHPAHTYQSSTKQLRVLLWCPPKMADIMYSRGSTLVVTSLPLPPENEKQKLYCETRECLITCSLLICCLEWWTHYQEVLGSIGNSRDLFTARNEVGARLYFHRCLSFC